MSNVLRQQIIEAQLRELATMRAYLAERDGELREELVQVMAENGYAVPMTEREKQRFERGRREQETQEDLRTLR